MSEEKFKPPQPVESHEVYHWPEFIAFAERLGIDWKQRTMDLTIKLELHGLVLVTHEYQAVDQRKLPDGAVNNTNLHNESFETFQPSAQPE